MRPLRQTRRSSRCPACRPATSRRPRSCPTRSRRRCPSASRQRPVCSPTPSWLPGPSAHSFPRYAEIDGVRPDSKPWHPSGLAIDIMIPNPNSPEGIALGDEILAFAMSNAGRIRATGCDLAWHVLHAGRSASIRLRPLRPRAHHHDATPLTNEAGTLPGGVTFPLKPLDRQLRALLGPHRLPARARTLSPRWTPTAARPRR